MPFYLMQDKDGLEGINYPIFLKNGDFLPIFDDEKRLLWQGALDFVPRRWFIFYERHNLGNDIWSDFKQKGISCATGIAWFWRHLPLPAERTVSCS